ncbi:MAG: U32 family peptidase, partial [Parasporobacterium sp.]|nr:U32 family peptidase [Parasporobacterium sp.]
MYKRPEVLAPAGTMEALIAAVNAGADAVYVGGSFFSARAFAGNFDEEELIRAIEFCHLYGVKLYMTVNTLLKSDEMERLPAYMEPYYHAGVDGIIVQDVGVAAVLKEHFPDLPLHGSTQMSITSRHGAALLKSMGFTRVVPARELSIEEIKNIKANVDIEIETFIHGAMCFAYSGKCLLSSYLGGRSGNRGRCAQPCRHMYKINTPSGTVNEYAMSLKDMNTLSLIPEIIAAGIDSLKIEGRMKKPEYVASTVAAYVKAVDWWMSRIEAAGPEGQASGNVLENSTG